LKRLDIRSQPIGTDAPGRARASGSATSGTPGGIHSGAH